LHLTGYTSLSQSKIKERYNWYILSEKGIKSIIVLIFVLWHQYDVGLYCISLVLEFEKYSLLKGNRKGRHGAGGGI